MGFLTQFKIAKMTSDMDSALREARRKKDGVEPLLAVLIEEVRLLRLELTEERNRVRQEADRPARR